MLCKYCRELARITSHNIWDTSQLCESMEKRVPAVVGKVLPRTVGLDRVRVLIAFWYLWKWMRKPYGVMEHVIDRVVGNVKVSEEHRRPPLNLLLPHFAGSELGPVP